MSDLLFDFFFLNSGKVLVRLISKKFTFLRSYCLEETTCDYYRFVGDNLVILPFDEFSSFVVSNGGFVDDCL